MSRRRAEKGQAMPLVLGIVLVVVAIAGVAVDVTRAALLRRGLQSVADSAAGAGASELDRERYYDRGRASAELDPTAAAHRAGSVVKNHLVRWVRVRSGSDGVRVSVGGRIRTSFLRLVGIRHLEMTAEAAAVPVLGDG